MASPGSSIRRSRRAAVGVALVVVSLVVAWTWLTADGNRPGMPQIRLDVVVVPTGDLDDMALRREIRCLGGPDEPDRCRELRQLGGPHELTRAPGEVCTQVHGGPAYADVEGVWAGQTVTATLTLRDGCDIARWRLLREPLGLPPL